MLAVDQSPSSGLLFGMRRAYAPNPMRTTYAIALGSNKRHPRHGGPSAVLDAALGALNLSIVGRSRAVCTRPLGPGGRCYANAAALVMTTLTPPELLDHLKAVERRFGRRIGGRRWSARVLDLDIILWSGGVWASPELGVPHAQFRRRDFVLGPLLEIAADWRDPLTGHTVRQLKARLDRKRPLA
jgi:2-amino-4-hydroxy-6-hydroxymethyldihydropteridine diphosphokinase